MDPTIKLALETIDLQKQAIVFCASRASAEKTAEDIAKKVVLEDLHLSNLALKAGKVVSPATKQCKRLEKMLHKGIAFHHSGLASKQKQLIEEEFRQGNIKIICATPTLAAGLSLPVFRVIIKSLKRYSGRWGMDWIPTLEYLQMAGRAGRPEYEDHGEAISIAKTQAEFDEIHERYVTGEPEDIYSKLAVEPVLRSYVLSLLASGILRDEKGLKDFFAKTFWAAQFGDLAKLEMIITKVLKQLMDWQFVVDPAAKESSATSSESSTNSFFTVGTQLLKAKPSRILKATPLGRRVSELYLDPLTANDLLHSLAFAQKKLQEGKEKQVTSFSYLHMVANTLEMFPLLRVSKKEHDAIHSQYLSHYEELLCDEPSEFDLEYPDFIKSVKTALFLRDWANEFSENILFERFNIRPGEIRVKLENADWLLYSCTELASLQDYKQQASLLRQLRIRIKHGVKEELLPLMKLKGVGRIRARKLYLAGCKTLGDLKKQDQSSLAQIVGPALAKSIKEQLGQEVVVASNTKRKGQVGLGKFN